MILILLISIYSYLKNNLKKNIFRPNFLFLKHFFYKHLFILYTINTDCLIYKSSSLFLLYVNTSFKVASSEKNHNMTTDLEVTQCLSQFIYHTHHYFSSLFVHFVKCNDVLYECKSKHDHLNHLAKNI